MKSSATEVLILDDNPEYASLTIAALTSAGRTRTYHADSPERAFESLMSGECCPDLILMDSRGPSGIRLLSNLKSDPRFRHIPVIVWANSQNMEAVTAAYDCFANCVIYKPAVRQEFERVADSISRFWLTCAMLPRHGSYIAGAAARGNSLF